MLFLRPGIAFPAQAFPFEFLELAIQAREPDAQSLGGLAAVAGDGIEGAVDDPRLEAEISVPDYLVNYQRGS